MLERQLDTESDKRNGTASINVFAQRAPYSMVKFEDVQKFYGRGLAAFRALSNVSFQVVEGEKYALMGPSGAGKSTIVSIVMGLMGINSGKVKILGKDICKRYPNRRAVGYMPQVGLDLGMYPEFSIKEIFQYYGHLYGMRQTSIDEMINNFNKQLHLPPLSRKLNTLSGGQQRLVCFATALFHSPKLVVMDEPTVGLDYVLKTRIWEYVEASVAQGTTVVIVTHDAEEADRCNRIGVMRKGRMIVEGSPSNLLNRYNVEYLEDVLFESCLLDELEIHKSTAASQTAPASSSISLVSSPPKEIEDFNRNTNEAFVDDDDPVEELMDDVKSFLESEEEMRSFQDDYEISKMAKILGSPQFDVAQADEVSITEMDNDGLFQIHVNDDIVEYIPLEPVFLTSTKVQDEVEQEQVGDGGKKEEVIDSPYPFVDEHFNPARRTLGLVKKNFVLLRRSIFATIFVCMLPAIQNTAIINSIGLDPRVTLGIVNFELNNEIESCPKMNTCKDYLDATLLSCMYLNFTESDHSKLEFFKNESSAIEAVHKGTISGYITLNGNFTKVYKKSLVNDPLTSKEFLARDINTAMDGTDAPVKTFILKTLFSAYFSFMERLKSECNFTSPIGEKLFKEQDPIFEKYDFYSKYLAVSIMIGILWFFPVASGTASMISERTRGIYVRGIIAGTNPLEMMVANLARPLFYSIIQISLCVLAMIFLENIKIVGSIPLLFVLASAMGILGEMFGFIFGSMFNDQVLAAFFVLGTYFPNLMLGGMLWPIESVRPEWLQQILWLLPASRPALAFRDVALRGMTVYDRSVYEGLIALGSWMSFLLIIFFFTVRKNRGKL